MAGFLDPILDLLGGSGGSDVNMPNVPLPELQKYNPLEYKSVGQYNPEMESVVTLGPSAMQGVSTDPALQAAQMAALNKLMGISDAGGRDAQFLSEQARLQNDVNANLRGNTGAIQQNLATRGFGGGMSEQVARQMAAQSGANRQAQMELDANAAAQQRALSALSSGAGLAGQMQGAQFSQGAQKAQAQDAISRFNAANTQDVYGANTDRTNSAKLGNLQSAQGLANMNTGERNSGQKYNTGLSQQQYENQFGQTQAQYGSEAAKQAREDAKRGQNLGFVGGLVGAGAQAWGKS
jgi:hypothetical protein